MRKLFSFISAAAAAAVLALLCMVAAMGGVNAAPSMLVDSNLERWSSLNSTYIGTTCSIYLCGDAGNDQQKCFDYQCCWQTQVNWGFNYNGDGVCVSYEPTSICNISAADRVAIGYPQITPAECLQQGGCWNPLPPTEVGPWCYAPVGYSPPPQQQLPNVSCNVGDYKVPCYSGWNNMNQLDCEAQGCCWEQNPNLTYEDSIPSSQSLQKQQKVNFFGNSYGFCYQPLMTCNVTYRERQNCGFPGISEQQCLERNCCFDPILLPPYLQQKYQTQDIPWCYYKNPVVNFPSGWNATAVFGPFNYNKSYYKKYYPKQQVQPFNPYSQNSGQQQPVQTELEPSSGSSSSSSSSSGGIVVTGSSGSSGSSGGIVVTGSSGSSYGSSSSGSTTSTDGTTVVGPVASPMASSGPSTVVVGSGTGSRLVMQEAAAMMH
jgi:hypothetical protein